MRVITTEDSSIIQVCLDCLPFFDTFSTDEKQELLNSKVDLICYDTGEFLIQEGGVDRVLFFLLSGAASVVKEGASIPVAELSPGDFFGEVAFLTGHTRTTNVIVHPVSETNTNGSTAVLSEKLCAQLCPDDPSPTIALRFNRTVLDQLKMETRIRTKDQIISVLVVRMEHMSWRVEETIGEAPEFCVDPDLERLLEEGTGENLEDAKDQIIQHLISFIELLNNKLVD